MTRETPVKLSIETNAPVPRHRLADVAIQYQPAIAAYFRRRGCNPTEVNDLVQEVFVRIAGSRSNKAINNSEAYLMVSASNIWRDHLRRQRTRNSNQHVEFNESEHSSEDFSAERVYEGREAIKQVIELLGALPEKTRNVFLLGKVQGMRHKEIANTMGISLSSVEKELVKAIAHLADNLTDT